MVSQFKYSFKINELSCGTLSPVCGREGTSRCVEGRGPHGVWKGGDLKVCGREGTSSPVCGREGTSSPVCGREGTSRCVEGRGPQCVWKGGDLKVCGREGTSRCVEGRGPQGVWKGGDLKSCVWKGGDLKSCVWKGGDLKSCGFNLSFPPARYQSEAGGPPYKAITYYHHAISIDPTKGISHDMSITILYMLVFRS